MEYWEFFAFLILLWIVKWPINRLLLQNAPEQTKSESEDEASPIMGAMMIVGGLLVWAFVVFVIDPLSFFD